MAGEGRRLGVTRECDKLAQPSSSGGPISHRLWATGRKTGSAGASLSDTESNPLTWLRVSFGLAVIAVAWSAAALVQGRKPPQQVGDLEWVAVRRGDLDTTLLAAGDLQPVKQTAVLCKAEDVTESEGMTIISVIDNGALVKKGDELCRLDSSEIEESARQQEIAANQARALCDEARLVLETAELELKEYQDGLVIQSTKEFEGRIALGRSDLARQSDRLAWTEAMAAKGYLAESKRLSERQRRSSAPRPPQSRRRIRGFPAVPSPEGDPDAPISY